jgi:AraC-like DNA-binding protein
MALLLAFLPDRVMRATLDKALAAPSWRAPEHEVHYAESWKEMHELARRLPAQLAIFNPYPPRELDVGRVERFSVEFPGVVLFAYGDFRRKPIQDVVRLAHAGVREVADRDLERNPLPLQLLLNGALSFAVVGQVLEALEDLLDPKFVPLMRYLLSSPQERITPKMAGKVYHAHPKTLRLQLRQAGLPTTGRLIVWTRLFHAGHLLSGRTRSAESVAFLLGYETPSLLQKQCRTYVGMTAGEMAEGGLQVVLEEFRRRWEVREWRLERRVAGRSDGQGAAIVREST